MNGTIAVSQGDDEVTIHVKGRFSFDVHAPFRAAYQSVMQSDVRPRRWTLDLGGTDYIDSSALGMMLLLKEAVGGHEADISIIRVPKEIRQILETANFQKLFTLS